VKRAGWWLAWCLCALLYPAACFVAWALRPSHRPGPWQPRARGRGVWLVCLAVVLSAGCSLFAASPAARPGNTAPDIIKKISAAAHEVCDPILGAVDGMVSSYDAPSSASTKDASPAAATDASADATEGGAP
jgi:hypothetical protein